MEGGCDAEGETPSFVFSESSGKPPGRGPAAPVPGAAAPEQVPPEKAPAPQTFDGLAAPPSPSAPFACKWTTVPPSALKANRGVRVVLTGTEPGRIIPPK